MLEMAHMPTAVADCDLEAIADRDEGEIIQMAEECGRWLQAFGDYRASLVTPPAMAVWSALVQGEFDQVSTLHERLRAELALRSGTKGE